MSRSSANISVGKTLRCLALFGTVSAFGLVGPIGSASAQQPQLPPEAFVVVVPPLRVPDSVPPPAPTAQVLGVVVEPTTTLPAITTTKVPTPAVVLSTKVAAAPAIAPEVLGTSLTSPVAFTGSNSTPTAALGAGLFGVGLALVVVARRRNKPRRAS